MQKTPKDQVILECWIDRKSTYKDQKEALEQYLGFYQKVRDTLPKSNLKLELRFMD